MSEMLEIIGLIELNSSFTVCLILFFLSTVEADDPNRNTSTVTLHKKKPSPLVEKIMKKEMQLEFQFYNFIKNKFYRTRDSLGIKPST